MAVPRIRMLLYFPIHGHADIHIVADELTNMGEIKFDLERDFVDADIRFFTRKGVGLEDHHDLRHYGLKNTVRLQVALLEYDDSDQAWVPSRDL
jgi:hypothetical protein